MLQKEKSYTPEQVADILQLNKNTVYELINRGEILAKKYGKVYRIPPSSISFILNGMDYDIYSLEAEDLRNQSKVNKALKDTRNSL